MLVSIVFLMLATGFTSVSPLIFGWAVDRLRPTPANIAIGAVLSLIAAYVISRILMQAFAQLRDGVFAKVQYHAMREVAVRDLRPCPYPVAALPSGAQDRRPVAA